MAVRNGAGWLLILMTLAGCAVWRSPAVTRVALLGPFEGRYREVGYNALYAARLALREMNGPLPTLLPIDDGGTLATAVARAEALALDPQVHVVIAVGYHATDPVTQAALGDLPVIIPGNWQTIRARHNVFLLANPTISDSLTISANADVVTAAAASAPLIGGDVLGLSQFAELHDSLENVTLRTVGQVPGEDFAARYAAGDPFAPQPNHLAMLTYDATVLAASAAQGTRAEASNSLASAQYAGLSGVISFSEGVWADAPANTFGFAADGSLRAVDDLVEQR